MKILLLGGTKDSTNIIEHIKETHDYHILTTTTTEYGAELAMDAGSDEVIARPLPKDEIIEIIKRENFDVLIDATHPFAKHITQTSASIANELEMPYIRFERPTTNLENMDTSHIHYADSFDEAGKLIESKFSQGNVLHFAGANTMEDILKHVDVGRFYPRILKVDAGVMITKESGDVGGVIEKIQSANEKDVAVVMIQRPKIDELNKNDIVSNLDELDIKLKTFFKK